MPSQNYLQKVALLLSLSIFLFSSCESPETNYVESESQTITIASFNIRIFSNNSRSDEELGYIADILDEYDLIAIQELRDEKVLQRTANILKNRGKEYDYEISPAVGKGVKELYAFLYKKDKIKKICQGKLYEERNDEFICEPFYATFKAGTLVTVHILFGSSEAERRPEIRELAKVYNKIQNENPAEQNIILL